MRVEGLLGLVGCHKPSFALQVDAAVALLLDCDEGDLEEASW